MFGALAAAALIAAASLTIGLAVLTLCGRRAERIVAGPVGLAVLLATGGIVAGFDGRGGAIAIGLGAVTLAAAGVVARTGLPPVPVGVRPAAIAAAVLAALFAALPFIAAGKIGILGVGLVNDDMASHLLLADWLDERFRPEPVLVDQGYPLGPHGLVAGLGGLLGASSIDVFAGLVLAIPALTAFAAAGAIRDLRPRAAVPIAALVALPYMAAAYLAQEAFKEPILALLLLGFALYLPAVRSARDAVPLGVLAAGVVYVYSFPGLAWLVGAAVVWVVVRVWREGWADVRRTLRSMDARTVRCRDARARPAGVRPVLPAVAAALLTLVLLAAPDLGRIVDFADFRALDPDRANEGGLGNLRGHLSPLEALGVWPTSEFRLSAGAGSLPAIAFYAGALVAAVGLVLGLGGWVRRYGWAIPSALVAAAVIYLGARAFGTVYSSGKALAIAAPFITLITLGGLMARGSGGGLTARGPGGRPPDAPQHGREDGAMHGRESAAGGRPHGGLASKLLALAIAVAMAFSSFLVLRQAPVGPTDHMEELAEIRPLVQGRDVLFLGRDNFVLHELRGSRPYTHVRNFYDPYFVEPSHEIRDAGSKFDFDALESGELARFPFVITTRAAYASGPPPSYVPVKQTANYVLWRRPASARARQAVSLRRPVEGGPAPGALLVGRECRRDDRRLAARLQAAPEVGGEEAWSGSSTVESGEAAAQSLRLGRGAWEISLQYDATRPIRIEAAGSETTLPANLDYRGVTPFWNAGRITLDHPTEVVFEVSVDEPPALGRLLGADSVAHLGAIAVTRAGPSYVEGAAAPFPGAGARIASVARACGAYTDWTAPPPGRP